MKGWNCNMEFNLSPNTKEKPNYIDLCTILNGEEPFQLPNHFNGIESKKKLITALKLSAMKSGFGLAHRSSKSLKQLDKDHQNLSAYLSLHCQHGLTYHGKEKSFELVSKTKFSRKCDVKCKFRINISLHKESKCWSIHNNKKTKMTTDRDPVFMT